MCRADIGLRAVVGRLAGALLLALLWSCGGAEPAPEAEVASPPASAERPPALEIGHTLGATDAPVEVIEFSDLGCNSCAEFAVQTLPALRREFIDTGLVRWRYVPIRQGFPRGEEAARAAECAGEQGRFWLMHDLLAERQREWQYGGDPAEALSGYARAIGLDGAAFDSCYASDRPESALGLHDMVALSMGIRGTPTFLAGGQRVFGALDADQFAKVLRDQLAARRGASER